MPTAAPKPCLQPGCCVLVRDGTSRCQAHKVEAGSFADKRRGSRHERGYGSGWDRTRARVLRRDAGICQPCLADGLVHRGTEVDHIVPKAQGGTDDDANLQTICARRHRAKTQREAQGRGVQISAAHPARTEPQAQFFCAQVSEKFLEVGDGR